MTTKTRQMTPEQFEARRRCDVDFGDTYDDYAHYCRVVKALRAVQAR